MKEVIGYCTKAGLDTAKTFSKKLVHKTAEATFELIGNKISKKFMKPKPVTNENSRNVEEIVIPREKREKILNELGKVI